MTKTELVNNVWNNNTDLGVTKTTVEAIVNSVLREISNSLSAGDSVSLHGFGTFKLKQRAARTARNPRTGQAVAVAASTSVGFSPSSTLKSLL